MIEPEDLYGIKHYDYGEAYYGSDNGKRFRIAREPLENVIFKSIKEREEQNPKLVAQVWYGKMGFDKTPESEITKREFEYSDEGYSEMIRWLNEV